jgi:hypothetical protein
VGSTRLLVIFESSGLFIVGCLSAGPGPSMPGRGLSTHQFRQWNPLSVARATTPVSIEQTLVHCASFG